MVFGPPIVIWTGRSVASSFYPTIEWLTMLTKAIAPPNVRFVQVDLVMECVINCDICASHAVDVFHDSFEIRSVATVTFSNILDE